MPWKYQLRWAGHVSRMEDLRLTKIAMYRELSSSHRESRAPRKPSKDCLRKSLTACHVDPVCWSDMAADRDARSHLIFIVADEFQSRTRNVQLEPCQEPHRTSLSHVDTAHNPAFPA